MGFALIEVAPSAPDTINNTIRMSIQQVRLGRVG